MLSEEGSFSKFAKKLGDTVSDSIKEKGEYKEAFAAFELATKALEGILDKLTKDAEKDADKPAAPEDQGARDDQVGGEAARSAPAGSMDIDEDGKSWLT
eukprot:12978625-Alexandrium_andersonii.AAC.1